ncbi:MAG: pyridoxamine 5'-phosphate oxidase family protein [Actinomycetota bacterium]
MTDADRPTLVELETDECWNLIAEADVGRVGFVTHDEPTILPVNHVIDDGAIYFRTGFGAKLDLAQRLSGSRVAFEVDGVDAEARRGWSVLVRGTVEPVLDTVAAAHLDRLGHHVWADDLERTSWVRIGVDELTGRRIESPPPD